jgi:hypothetical protein
MAQEPALFTGAWRGTCTFGSMEAVLRQTGSVVRGEITNAAGCVWRVSGSGFGSRLELPTSIAPVAGDMNTVKGGSTVPLKFNVCRNGGIEITNPADISNLSFAVASIACTAGEAGALVPLTTTGSTGLRYDTTGGQFVQNWTTPRTPGCSFA